MAPGREKSRGRAGVPGAPRSGLSSSSCWASSSMGRGQQLPLPKADFPLPFSELDRQQSKLAEREGSDIWEEDRLHFSLPDCPQLQSGGIHTSASLTGLQGEVS